MSKRMVLFLALATLLAIPALAADAPATHQIAGINAKDPYPNGCVDCHVKRAGMPAPLSADTKQWAVKVDPKLLAKVQPLAPKGMTLKGKHPNVASMIKEIPSGCLKCHAKGSKMAPPLSAIAHVIHLTDGDSNPFLTADQGECTSCHKLHAATGEMVLGSGPEK